MVAIYSSDRSAHVYRERKMDSCLHGRSCFSCVLTGTFLIVASLGLLAAADVSLAEKTFDEKVHDSLEGDWGKIFFNLRYRFEHVEQDNNLQTANGDPVRLRLGYLTPKYAGFQAYAEFLGNTSVFLNDYNDNSNGKTQYSVINDPNEATLNQGWHSVTAIPDTDIKAGRQKIDWDNERFICPAAWRQMEQTFDSVTLLNTSVADLSLRAAYLWNAITTSNEDVNMQSPLVNVKYAFEDIGSISGYGYWLDYDDPDDSGPFEYAYSSQTYGLHLNGSPEVADNLKFLYTAAYAAQSDYGDNPRDFTADYYNVIGGILVPNKDSLLSKVSGRIGYEVYGSDNGVSFQTPLGANHRYNGWADLFGKTKPADGLRDLYGALSSTIAGVKIDLVYHDFKADTGGSDYGTEFDTMLTKTFAKHYTLLASYSYYNADDFKTDTQKFWLQLTVNYSSPLIAIQRWWLR